jgi:hypothetical protein
LETKQLAEIDPAIDRRIKDVSLVQQFVEPGVIELHLQLLVEVVGHLLNDALALGGLGGTVGCSHGSLSRAKDACRPRPSTGFIASK